MLLSVRLGRFVGMHPGLPAVTVRGVRVVRRLLVTAGLVMLRRLSMMFRGVSAMQ
jgi:hypothetical protein